MRKLFGLTIQGLVLAALLIAAPQFARGHAGAGAVAAMKNGDFTVRYFGGTQTGIDSAVTYCAPGGIVTMGPGLEALNPTGPIPAGVLVQRNGNNGWNLRGNGATAIVPRLGPASTTTTGGAIRIVDGVTFPLSVAGVQAAIDEVNTVGSGEVWVPASANILITNTPIKLRNKVKLKGFAQYEGLPTFRADATTNVPFMIGNFDTTGAQNNCYIENIQVKGGWSLGGRVDAGIKLKRLFVGSGMRDVLVNDVSGVGVRIEGGGGQSIGQFEVTNLNVLNGGDVGVLVFDGARNIWFNDLTVQRPGRNTACLRIDDNNSAAASVGVRVNGFYTEITDTMSVGIDIKGASGVEIDNYTASVPSGRMRSCVRIANPNNNNHNRSPSGITIRGMTAFCDTLIEDLQNSLVYTVGPGSLGNPYMFVDWYSTPLFKGTTSTNGYRASGQKIGIQPAKRGPDIASAATIVPHLDGNYYVLTGTTTITSITGAPYFLYKMTVFEVGGALQLTDGGNLNLNGNFVGNGTGGIDTLVLIWDGTNWNEVDRSLN